MRGKRGTRRDGKNETEGKIDTGVGNKARGRTGVPEEGEGTMCSAPRKVFETDYHNRAS